MTPPTTDTSREAVEKFTYVDGWTGGKLVKDPRGYLVRFSDYAVLLAERDAALLREKSLKDNTEELRQLRREFNAMCTERDALRDQLAAARNEALDEFGKAADKLGHHCIGCGHLCGDPNKDLANIRKSGGVSCCPERQIEPLSSAIASMIKSTTSAPREVTVQEAARVLLANRWAGYGNSKAMQAMCNYVHADQGRMPFPASFYDGVMQAGLQAIAQEGQSDG